MEPIFWSAHRRSRSNICEGLAQKVHQGSPPVCTGPGVRCKQVASPMMAPRYLHSIRMYREQGPQMGSANGDGAMS